MRPTRKLIAFLPVLLVLLLACQFSGTATPAVLNGTPAAPASQPYTTSARKTVSPFITPTAGPPRLPPRVTRPWWFWSAQTRASRPGCSSPRSRTGDTAESVTGQVAAGALQRLTNVTTVSDGALTRSDSVSGWSRVVTANSNGTDLKISLTTLINGPREFSLLTYGDVPSYTANAKRHQRHAGRD